MHLSAAAEGSLSHPVPSHGPFAQLRNLPYTIESVIKFKHPVNITPQHEGMLKFVL